MSRPDLLNRIGFALVGGAVAAAGGYGLARGSSALGASHAHDPVLDPRLRAYVVDHRHWFWWAAGAACVGIALLALGWLRAQLHLPRPANHDLVRSASDGTTRLDGGAAADALAADISTLPGVVSADARLWGDAARPEVYVRVEAEDTANLAALEQRIEDEPLSRLRGALQVDRVESRLDVRLAPPRRALQ